MSFVFLSAVYMIVVLGIMVMVHEFGHFIVAKACGVRVEVFSVGFGKRLFGVRRGDTDYRISLLPFGGYVKMSGESPSDSPTSDPGAFTSHPRWQRILIASAGPAANFLLAFFLLTLVFMAHNEVPDFMSGPTVLDYVQPGSAAANAGLQRDDRIVLYDGVHGPNWQQVFVHTILNLGHRVQLEVQRQGQTQDLQLRLPSLNNPDDFSLQDLGIAAREQQAPIQVASVEPSMPGQRAGLRAGDQLLALDGVPFRSLSSIVLYLQQQAGRPATLTVLRNGKTLLLTVRPEQETGPRGNTVYQIGFSAVPPPYHVEHLPLFAAMRQSVHENIKGSTLIVDVLRRMATLRMSMRALSGPVGIARETGHIVSMPGWTPLFDEMATISLNLGILNLLPIPVLDGGAILLLLIEGLMRRDLDQVFKERIYQTAFVFLVLVFAIVLFNDLTKMPIFAHLHGYN
jgi:regulator of sigma E protease